MQNNSLTFNPGDIAIASLPFSDGSGTKRRPVLTISKRSDSMVDVIVLKITRTKRISNYCIPIMPEDLEGTRLKSPSHISVDFITTLQKSVISAKIATLKPKKILEVKEKLRELLDL